MKIPLLPMSTRQTTKQQEQQTLTEANSFDYFLHSAGVGILLYSTGTTIQQPSIGLFFTFTAWVGLLISFLVRRLASNSTWGFSLPVISGWFQLGIAILVLVNLKTLNQMLPGEALSLELYPMAFLAWFIALGAFLLWSDGTLYFQSVPGIALLGLLSWLETSVYFEMAIVLYMVIIAVLLTRLHTRAMHARAVVVGFRDLSQLRRNQWRGMAGPGLAIFSVLVVAGVSKVVAPYLGGAIRTIVGSPLVPTSPHRPDGSLFLSLNVHRVIGTGPRSSSRLPILRVRVEGPVQYLRAGISDHYTGIGSREPSGHTIELSPVSESPRVQPSGAKVYRVENPFGILKAPLVRAEVESLGRSHSFAYMPGVPIRIEYNGNVSIVNGEFLAFGDAFPSGKSYSVWAIGFPSLSPEMRSAGVSQRAENQVYYERNNQIAPEVQRLALNVIQNTTSDYDAAMSITREVGRRCRYNLKAPALRGREDRVKQFLFETREGYCDLFASAVTIMCRSVGLRSRIAYGYILDPETMRDGWYIVEDRHAHIWSEVYLEGYGWVPFDATAYAESVPGGGVGDVLETEGENSILRWAGAIALILFGGSFAILVGVSAISWWRTRRRVLPAYRALRPLYLYYVKEL
ncbi:MAG: transglutaminase domain-containing protein, partial [Candidatus Caldarchaeum sp.]